MSEDRLVHTDALKTLGQIIDAKQGRDAIHLAVEPVVAAERLSPGQDVGLVDGRVSGRAPVLLGIVDPFLKRLVQPGERFWLIVYPRQITSLRHVWEHPNFPDIAGTPEPKTAEDIQKADARVWIEQYARGAGVRYEELMFNAADHVRTGDYWTEEGGRFEGESVPDEFWDHYEIVTGAKVEENSDNFFSCAC